MALVSNSIFNVVPTLIRNVPGAASYFLVLEISQKMTRDIAEKFPFLKRSLVVEDGKLSATARFSCGASSRAFVGFAFMPASLIKTRFEVWKRSYYPFYLCSVMFCFLGFKYG